MEYRLNKQTLIDFLGQWNAFLKRRVHLVACGGTALMLMKSRKENIDLTRVEKHVRELARYDISEKRIVENLEDFLNLVRKETLDG